MAQSSCHYLSEFALCASGVSVDVVNRDAKSPVSGRRLQYLDVHYGLLYSRTYLHFHLLPTARPAATATCTLVKPLVCC